MIGSARFQTEVHAGVTVRAPAPMERAAQFAPLEASPPAPADLELRVTKAETDNRLLFTLNSSLPQVPFHAAPMGEVVLNSKDPMAFLARQLDRLSNWRPRTFQSCQKRNWRRSPRRSLRLARGCSSS